MDIPPSVISAFPPSPDLLLDRTRRRIDDAMLMEIARADYGQRADEMFAALRPIRDQGIIPFPMEGMLFEVLELTQYCRPETPERPPFEPGPTGIRGHHTRLFACAVLMRAAAELENPANDTTLAACLASAKALGNEMSETVARFLTWRLSRPGYSRTVRFELLALLVCGIRFQEQVTQIVVGDVAESVLAGESLDRSEFAWNAADPEPVAFSLQQGDWRPMLAELRIAAEAMPEGELRTNLQLCALLLTID